MSVIDDAVQFYYANTDKFWTCFSQHLQLTLACMALCLAIGLPLGYVCAKKAKIATPVITAVNAFCTVPVIAMFLLLIPFLGLGPVPATIVILMHSLLAMLINTIGGIRNVPADVVESARGMGYDDRRICFEIELPLAMPVILNGFRTATVGIISGATLAAYISAGGLGVLVLSGISGMNYGELLLSGGTIVLMVLFFDALIGAFQHATSRYLR